MSHKAVYLSSSLGFACATGLARGPAYPSTVFQAVTAGLRRDMERLVPAPVSDSSLASAAAVKLRSWSPPSAGMSRSSGLVTSFGTRVPQQGQVHTRRSVPSTSALSGRRPLASATHEKPVPFLPRTCPGRKLGDTLAACLQIFESRLTAIAGYGVSVRPGPTQRRAPPCASLR